MKKGQTIYAIGKNSDLLHIEKIIVEEENFASAKQLQGWHRIEFFNTKEEALEDLNKWLKVE